MFFIYSQSMIKDKILFQSSYIEDDYDNDGDSDGG